MSRRLVPALAAAVAVTSLLAACGQSSTASAPAATTPAATSPAAVSPVPSSPAATATPAAPKPSKAAAGAYITFADYQAKKAAYDADGKVVLFFHAGWCPTCQRAERNIESEPVPAGLTIVKTDFDSSDDLRQQYGITVQHTFVQVSPDGSQLAKFTGSDSATEILGKTV